jgi:hypothetical protein
VLFCVLFVCKYVLPPGNNPTAVNKLSHHNKGLSKIYCFINTEIVRNNTFFLQNFVLIYEGGQEFKGTIDLQHNVMCQDKCRQADRRQTCVLMNQATRVPALLITY